MSDSDWYDALELPDNFHAQNREHNYFMELWLAFKKRNELKQAYDSFGKDQFDSEKIIILLRKALITTEEELAKNPDSIFMKEQKAEIERYIANINKLLGENQIKKTYSPEMGAIFLHYPEFKKDLPLLQEHKYISIDENGILTWRKSKKSLAEYFGKQKTDGKNNEWILIEKLFRVKDLKNSFSTNGKSYDRTKPSADYEKWLEIKKCEQNTPEGV